MSKKISVIIIALIMLLTLQINAIENKDNEIFKVNDKVINNDTYYNELNNISSYNNVIATLDKKVMEEKYKNDSRLKDIIEKKYKDAMNEKNEQEQFKLYKATNKEDFIEKVIKLEAYRELAAKDCANDNIFTNDQKDYVYKHKISGTIKISHILISPSISAADASNVDALNKAKAEALKKAEEIIVELNKGANFSELAAKNSSDQLTNDGYLGEYTIDSAKEAKLDQSLINEAFDLENQLEKDKKTKYSIKPVANQFGYEIVYIESTKAKISKEDAKNQMIDILYDLYTGNNSYTEQYALALYRDNNKIKIDNNLMAKAYANSYLNIKKSYVTFDPSQNQYQQMMGY